MKKKYIVTLVWGEEDYLVINKYAYSPSEALEYALNGIIDTRDIIQVIIDIDEEE